MSNIEQYLLIASKVSEVKKYNYTTSYFYVILRAQKYQNHHYLVGMESLCLGLCAKLFYSWTRLSMCAKDMQSWTRLCICSKDMQSCTRLCMCAKDM